MAARTGERKPNFTGTWESSSVEVRVGDTGLTRVCAVADCSPSAYRGLMLSWRPVAFRT
jgi:hypothetical protein